MSEDHRDPPEGPVRVAAPGVRLPVRASYLAERIDPATGESRRVGARRPTLTAVGDTGWAVTFRHGAVVSFGLSDAEEESFVSGLGRRLVDPIATPEVEEADLVVTGSEEGPQPDAIRVRDLSAGRLLVVAEVLARSAALAYHEGRVAEAFDRMEPLAERLRTGRRPASGERALLRQLGDALLTQTRTVGRVEIADKPEVLWEHPELERLWERLSVEYELSERDRALARKLELVSDVTRTLFDLIQERQVLRVEWYIVVLILFEIVLTLWGMFVAG